MLYEKQDITEEIMIKEKLVAFITDDLNVHVLKNTYTGETGKMSPQDYGIMLSMKDRQKYKSQADNSQEDILEDIIKDTFKTAEKTLRDIKSTVKPSFDSFVSALSETIQDSYDNFGTEVQEKTETINYLLELKELELVLSTSKRLKVSTKKFEAKVLKRISEINKLLKG
jgi:hypothetical protein